MAEKKKLEIKQVRSGIGRPEPHRRTLRALGIKRHQQSVGSRSTANGVFYPDIIRQAAFELFDFRTHNILAVVQNR